MMWEIPDQIRGRTLLCKVDDQDLKAIIEKKESTRKLPLIKIRGVDLLDAAIHRVLPLIGIC